MVSHFERIAGFIARALAVSVDAVIDQLSTGRSYSKCEMTDMVTKHG